MPAPDFTKLMENPLWLALYSFVLIGAAAFGAVLTGLVGRYSAVLLWKELSRPWILRLRLVGGLAGAVIAYVLIGSSGGVGFGPGPGGLPGRGPGLHDGSSEPSLADKTQLPSEPSPKPPAKPSTVVQVVMLGPDTKPASEENRYFAIQGQDPAQALSVDQVIEQLRRRMADSPIEEVELVVTKQSSSFAKQFVEPLRERVRRELRLAFSEPNFSGDPLKDRSRFEPVKGP